MKHYGPKTYTAQVTLETASGVILRTLPVTARDRGEAIARAKVLAPKAGQTVQNVTVRA